MIKIRMNSKFFPFVKLMGFEKVFKTFYTEFIRDYISAPG